MNTSAIKRNISDIFYLDGLSVTRNQCKKLKKFSCRYAVKRKWKKKIKIKKIHRNFDIFFQTIASITISASSGMCK